MADALDEADCFAVAASRLAGLMALRLGWTPAQFWDATPAELHSIFAVLASEQSGGTGAMPPDADALARLMKEFPDG